MQNQKVNVPKTDEGQQSRVLGLKDMPKQQVEEPKGRYIPPHLRKLKQECKSEEERKREEERKLEEERKREEERKLEEERMDKEIKTFVRQEHYRRSVYRLEEYIKNQIRTFLSKPGLFQEVKDRFQKSIQQHKLRVEAMDQTQKDRFYYYHIQKVFRYYRHYTHRDNPDANQRMNLYIFLYMIYTKVLREQFDCIRMRQIANDQNSVELKQQKAGTILLNKDRTKFVMFKNHCGVWSPPKGSIDTQEFYENETVVTAKKETWEEVGYDVSDKLQESYSVKIPYNHKESIMVTYYIIENVDEDYKFEEKQRYKENYNQTQDEYWHDIETLPIEQQDGMIYHTVQVCKYLKSMHYCNFPKKITLVDDQRLQQRYRCKKIGS